ncbi:MAG: type II secretion system protein, partial [Candidatus Wallbacteria bacterium]|nr:type II secretion system protein [Candidatus Wallbacteria bacterium]
MIKMLLNNRLAVSLVEILVVSVIISILALLAVPAPGFSQKKKEELQVKSTVSFIRTALYNYQQMHYWTRDILTGGVMQEITTPAFPAWEKYTNEYPQLTSYGISTVEIQTNGIKYMVDLLEASLLKPSDMEIDRRKKVLDSSTGYYYYNVPDGAYYAK